MINKTQPRTKYNTKWMLNENDYFILKSNANKIINEISKAEADKTSANNKLINDLITFINDIYLEFLDVFIMQTNNCFIEKITDNNNIVMLATLKESEFYTHILDGHFEEFLNVFETKEPFQWIVRLSYSNQIQIFNLEYFSILKAYLYRLINSNDYYEFVNHSSDIFTEKSWLFSDVYEELTATYITPEQKSSLQNWWKEYTEEHDKFMARFNKN